MARLTLPIVPLTSVGENFSTGLQTGTSGSGNGFQFPWGADVVVLLKSDASPRTATLKTVAQADGLVLTDPTIALTASNYFLAGPFDPEAFRQADGMVYIEIDNAGLQAKAWQI